MKAKPNRYYHRATGYVDPDLKDLFRAQPMRLNRRELFSKFMRAEVFIKIHKQQLLTRVAYWVGVDYTVVFDLFDKLMTRAKVLNLWMDRAQEEKKLIELTTYITTLSANYKNSGVYLK